MKTKRFILIMLTVACVANVFATETPKMNVVPLKDTKALIAISQETPSIHEISIISEDGKIVYFKKSENEIDNYRQIFDLSQLENGAYKVKLRVGATTVKRGLKIDNGTISVEEAKTEFDPFFAFNDNVLEISYLNFEKEDVVVHIYSDRQLICKKKLGSEFALHQGFDLSKLNEGNYDVVLANANDEYWYSVTR